MILEKPIRAEVRRRGQITIPKRLRVSLDFEEGRDVDIFAFGNGLWITPRRLELDEARRQIASILKKSGLTPEKVLKSLSKERTLLYQEKYGKRN